MNYSEIYDKIINRAKIRTLDGYFENHHIIPKCLGGTNCKSNLVKLTPEEHYLVHQLLVKMHPGNKKLVYAVAIMCQSNDRMIRSNKLYGWIRRALSETRRNVPKTEEHKQKLREANIGKILSEETCAKMSKARIGNTYGKANKGKPKPIRSQVHKDNLSMSLRKPKSDEGKKNIGLGAIKRSIDSIIEKKELYMSFYKMHDENYSKQEIKEKLNIKERAYYGYISNRSRIENTIKVYQDAQSFKS